MVMIVIFYPIILFFSLMSDGFNPYDDLSHQEEKLEGGIQAQILYLFRVILHMALIVVSIYVFVMLITLFIIRRFSTYPGKYLWIAVKMSKMPYGSLFFEEGEFFDCGICISGHWKGNQVVRLGCNNKHVYHAECLRT